MFQLKPYFHPDFTEERFVSAPNAVLVPCPADGVAPEGYHALSIFPEYFKIDGQWILAGESRMDCVPVYKDGKMLVQEFRVLKKDDLVVIGRTENCEDGIYVHPDGFRETKGQIAYTIVETDDTLPENLSQYLRINKNIHDVMIVQL